MELQAHHHPVGFEGVFSTSWSSFKTSCFFTAGACILASNFSSLALSFCGSLSSSGLFFFFSFPPSSLSSLTVHSLSFFFFFLSLVFSSSPFLFFLSSCFFFFSCLPFPLASLSIFSYFSVSPILAKSWFTEFWVIELLLQTKH